MSVLFPGELVVFNGKEERLKDLTEREGGAVGDVLHDRVIKEQRMPEGLIPDEKSAKPSLRRKNGTK